MFMTTLPISIRIKVIGEGYSEKLENSREQFWGDLRRVASDLELEENLNKFTIDQLESRILQELGPTLHNKIVGDIDYELRKLERLVLGTDLEGYMYNLQNYFEFSKKERYSWPPFFLTNLLNEFPK